MRVMVTGAAGFLGTALTRRLLSSGRLAAGTGGLEPINELVLVDRHPVAAPPQSAVPVRTLAGDLASPAFAAELAQQACDSIFHLAATLTLQAEQDPVQAYATNVAPVRHLIEGAARPPRFVFASSIAVFGGALPDVVDDTVRAEPDTTYGTHKAIVELLLANYSRLGRADARALRLPIVLIRPGAASPAVSDRVAAIVREPLSGRDVVCGLAPDTRIPVASAGAVAEALVRLHDTPAGRLPHARAMNLPALTVSIAEMAASVLRRGGRRAVGAIRYEADAALQRIVDSWPAVFVSNQASTLGLHADADFDAIIDQYLADAASPVN
ncbi:NAD-dependent epimerase/dehydratase family protein [Bordetella sp. BOR01]|uniref:NAD-dependent epimerase/dehydratase family protein n=1 Tax=Bordetella sp. BOR01 TaxID=2854779 RepID=UPI001C46C81B|nr:NAD-dependent epimerase/dehydratase family protein [Bordetella sp. BOR01]MBV7484562.1 NAD-dependent epimerase/dehydratase family protein [Bordetella sp. BOR01]